eukprot:GABV01001338.1.p1 GENE.GABV01001338.1~~GABV01001338.1.p1  ORF type:complete len:248 (-),score=119.93 GABV01001338.1:40-783(-)
MVGPHMNELKSAKWKEKLSGIGSVLEKVEAEGKGIDSKADAMMAFLSKYPGFGEKNFQVVNKAMETAATTAVNSPSFSGKHAFMAFPQILEKYTEKKCAETVDKTLMAFAQAIGPTALVNGLVIPQLDTQKKPGALQGGVAFIGKAIEEFGITMVDVKGTIAGLKKYVDSRQRPVKDAAMASILTVFKASNGMLRGDLLQGLAKNIAGTLEKSFDKVPADEMGKPAKRAPPKKKNPPRKTRSSSQRR